MSKIINGSDVANEKGFGSFREYMQKLPDRKPGIPRWNGKILESDPVKARVDFGRWLADCECGGAEYVYPGDPIFFCFSCGNKKQKGAARPVEFPDSITLSEIEFELLDRPIIETIGMSPSTIALNSRPVMNSLSRSWNPGETVEDLKKQKKVMVDLIKAKVK